jgi:hypothetical protein
MKRILLTTLAFVLSGFVVISIAQETLTLTIIETGKDGETSISFDDGEYENGVIDKMNDDDLDMGWEGDVGNIMAAFTRFQNVTIPQGTPIDSAVLVIYAHEQEPDPAMITLIAEAIDSSLITPEDDTLANRIMTTASVRWEITEEWTMWEPYHSPNLAPIIQELIDRPGWVSGNALTLFLIGEDQGFSLLDNARDFESYENIEDPGDGGDGLQHPERVPSLEIFYGGATSNKWNKANGQSSSLISVYPNPVDNGRIQVSSERSGPMKIEIFNVTGRLVKVHEQSTQSVMLDVSDLNDGFYVVRVTQEEFTDIQKIIIK